MNIQGLFMNESSLIPEINIRGLVKRQVIGASQIVFHRMDGFIGDSIFWSHVENREVKFGCEDNPVDLFGEEDSLTIWSESFQKKTPSVGFYADSFSLALYYRPGPNWSNEAIEVFMVTLDMIHLVTGGCEIRHLANEFDPDGRILTKFLEQRWTTSCD